MAAEEGVFAPRQTGAMAATARRAEITIATPVRGIHAWLCRLRLHAWQRRMTSRSFITDGTGLLSRPQRCAVCGVVRRG